MASQTLTAYESGHIRNIDSDWDTTKDASSGDALGVSDSLLFTEGWTNGPTSWIIARAFLTFQIPAIPTNNIITSAALSFTTLLYGDDAYMIKGTRGDPENDLTLADFDAVDFNVIYSDDIDAYPNPTFTLNSTGLDYLNSKHGSYAELVLVNNKDFTDTEPSGTGNRAYWKGADDETYYPRLAITYQVITGVGTTHIGKGTSHVSSNAKIIV